MNAAGMPAPQPARRRRRWPIVAVILAFILGAIFVAADRVAVGVAQDRVATRLAAQRPFQGRPAVTIHGFPFLTQALGGTYHDIELTGVGEPVAGMVGAHVDVRLHGAHIPLSAVRHGVDNVPVDRVVVTITLPLSELARVAGVPDLRLSSDGHGNLLAQAPVSLAGVGSVTVGASVHLDLAGGQVRGALSDLHALGVTLPSGVLAGAEKALAVKVTLPNLGFDSALASIRVVGNTFVLSGSADHVVLSGAAEHLLR